MRSFRLLFFSVVALTVTQFAWGQSHDPSFSDRSEPVKMVKVFPNPASDFISLKFETPIAREVKVTLHNIIGNILEVESEIVDNSEIRLRVKELPTGVYLLAVKDADNTQHSIKFLKR